MSTERQGFSAFRKPRDSSSSRVTLAPSLGDPRHLIHSRWEPAVQPGPLLCLARRARRSPPTVGHLLPARALIDCSLAANSLVNIMLHVPLLALTNIVLVGDVRILEHALILGRSSRC
jgi:hypothetical protein